MKPWKNVGGKVKLLIVPSLLSPYSPKKDFAFHSIHSIRMIFTQNSESCNNKVNGKFK